MVDELKLVQAKRDEKIKQFRQMIAVIEGMTMEDFCGLTHDESLEAQIALDALSIFRYDGINN